MRWRLRVHFLDNIPFSSGITHRHCKFVRQYVGCFDKPGKGLDAVLISIGSRIPFAGHLLA